MHFLYYYDFTRIIGGLGKKALFAPSVVGKCSFIGHKLRFAA